MIMVGMMWSPLNDRMLPKFYNCQFWAPSFLILAKTENWPWWDESFLLPKSSKLLPPLSWALLCYPGPSCYPRQRSLAPLSMALAGRDALISGPDILQPPIINPPCFLYH